MNKLLIHSILLPVVFTAGIFFSSAQTTIYNVLNSPLPDNRVNKVVVDKDQNIWCATENGVAVFNGSTWIVYNSLNSGLTDNYIRSISFDVLGRVWIGTLSAGFFVFDGVTWTHLHSGNSGLNDDSIKDIRFDSSGHWWIATTGGLNYYDSTSWTVWNVFNSTFFTNNVSFIRFKGKEKHCGTINGGLHILDSANAITNYNTFNSGIHDNTLPDGEFDAAGALWLATPAAGLMIHYNGNTWQWLYTGTSNIPTNSLNSICLSGNMAYMTSYDNGLVVYDGLSFSGYTMSNSALPEDYLLDVAKDTLGNLWLGSYSQGLIKIVESTLRVNNLLEQNNWSLLTNLLAAGQNIKVNGPTFSAAEIIDIQGRVIPLESISSNEIETKNLRSGYYFLTIKSERAKQTIPFIITSN